MKIITPGQALHVTKPTGISVDYYLFDEYEIHFNEQPPHSVQDWHHHATIWETLFILEGELIAKWKSEKKEHQTLVSKGDVIETEHTPHIFENQTDKPAKFLVIKQVLSGEKKKELLKTDKILD